MNIRIRYILFLALVSSFAFPDSLSAQIESEFVDPRDTDASIDDWTESHFIAIDPNQVDQNKLFVFFPGTAGLPRAYRTISTHAASLGFHVIGLNYPNDRSVNGICRLNLDLNCYEDVRLETLDGVDRGSEIEISRSNSIENRLIKLLEYLDTNRSGQGWGNYLNSNSEVIWDDVIVAGHSQGGGHAAMIASQHSVSRVLMFASHDYNNLQAKPAPWIDKDNPTSSDRYLVFGHLGDELVDAANLEETWSALGLENVGSIVNIDTATTLAGASRLWTNSPHRDHILTLTPIHNSIAVDVNIPLLADGSPALKDVWTYMILGQEVGVRVEDVVTQDIEISTYPNPFSEMIRVKVAGKDQAITIRIFDVLGKLKLAQESSSEILKLDTESLSTGLYFLEITSGRFSKTVKVVKT